TGPGGAIGDAGNDTFVDAQGNVTQGAVTITNSTFVNNFSGAQGGAFGDENGQNTLVVLNSTFVDNTTTGNGGGIEFAGSGGVTINDSTVVGNAAQGNGGGLFVQAGSAFTLNNTIAAQNFAGPANFMGGTDPDVSGAVTAGSGNFIGIKDVNLTG